MKHLRFEDLPMAMESVLDQLTRVEEELENIKMNFQPMAPVELMTRQEVADYFKINITTLWNWTKKGRLKSYGIGYRVYYKRSEIETSLIKIV
ncbi:helix-turn-helix domain-containing protein [Arenibacter sp. M-2]|uniref:helix-turn-helix domain-containing protein n=1 Tax=Arenibacter sp. M-2 TaxID=3053612 RepID=UPI00256FFA26|nr:helix-turn-helix domain-containing protein [Arenibacter sp. M-2]MDL5511722.1 helix-turn-helix domain-containing protein [Arenibacter sp. M-2]